MGDNFDIQAYLNSLNAEIEESKNLVSMSISSSISLATFKKPGESALQEEMKVAEGHGEPVKMKEAADSGHASIAGEKAKMVRFLQEDEEVPNPFLSTIKSMEKPPEKPIFEPTLVGTKEVAKELSTSKYPILNEIEESLDWNNLKDASQSTIMNNLSGQIPTTSKKQEDDDLVELTNTSFYNLGPDILNNLTIAASKAAEEKEERDLAPKMVTSEAHDRKRLTGKSLKAMQIYRLTSQLHQFYAGQLREKRTHRYFIAWLDLTDEVQRRREEEAAHAQKMEELAQIQEMQEKLRAKQVFRITLLLQRTWKKQGVEQFKVNRIEAIEKMKERRLNFRALKHWSKQVKKLVFIHGFLANKQRVEHKREMNFKALLFQESTSSTYLMQRTFREMKDAVAYRKQKKMNLSIAAEHSKKRISLLAYAAVKQWKMTKEQRRLAKTEKMMKANYFRLKVKSGMRLAFEGLQTLLINEDHDLKISQIKSTVEGHNKKQVLCALKLWQTNRKQKRSNLEAMDNFHRRQLLRGALQSFKKIRVLKEKEAESGSIVAQALEKIQIRSSFEQIKKFGILINFGSNEAIASKIVSLQYFRHWASFAQYDRRQLKLMGRAVKHRNRRLKMQLLKALEASSSRNSAVFQRYCHGLLDLALKSFKKFMIKRRVKILLRRKAQEHWESKSKSKYYHALVEGAQRSRVESKDIREKMKISAGFHASSGTAKAVKALKLYTYRMRVCRYLEQKYTKPRLFDKYFNLMRERHFQLMTLKLREQSAENKRLRFVSKGVFGALKAYARKQYVKKILSARAEEYRRGRLTSISLSLLKFYADHSQVKKASYFQAVKEREGSGEQQSLLKLVEVGMYWAKIKGRFKGSLKDGASRAQRRIHLAMKYGSIWRAKVQVRRFERMGAGAAKTAPTKHVELRSNNQIDEVGYKSLQAKLGISTMTRQQDSQVSFATGSHQMFTSNAYNDLAEHGSLSGNLKGALPENYATEREPTSHGTLIQERIQAITLELNKFKEEKLLLKQMQAQLATCPASQANKLTGEVDAFRAYLKKKQADEIKKMVEEISQLKQAQVELLGSQFSQFDNLSLSMMSQSTAAMGFKPNNNI